MPNNSSFVASVNGLLAKLEDNPTVDTGIELANQIVSLFGEVNTKSVEDVFESSIELPNAERYDSWFQPHPIFKSDRACFDLADSPLLQAKFYWLKKRSRQIIAGGVHFTPNYEDEEFTHNERYKVGLDFFLSPNGKSLQVVLSNRGNLRIVELAGRLNNTQKEIFEKWLGAGSLHTQEALHTTLWESFKLKSVNQKFYDGVSNSFTELLQHLKSIDKDEEEAKLFASRLLGRLLFCWFLRKKGIIDESVGYFNAHGADATAYYKQSLERLFFLTLNTPVDERDELTKQHQKALFPELLADDRPSLFKTDQKTPYLNGGLFEPHENDWYKDDSLTLPKGFFTNLYDHFEEFNFTTDESSPEYEQIAIDPEMLGRVFESLLATQNAGTGGQARKAKGAFYTPREIVSYMCKESLRNYLHSAIDDASIKESVDNLIDVSDKQWSIAGTNSIRDNVPKDHRLTIIEALDRVTVLDPACGSGAFPMGMLQLMLKTYERLESRFDPYKTKLSIIQNNVFGVDIEPMAVEISRLRAWLSLIVDEEDSKTVEPLPNLDFKFVCANSLIPLDKEMGLFSDSSLHQKLKDIRTKYFNARKKHTKKALQDEYYKMTSSEQTSLITDDNRTKQLKSFDPFKYSHPSDFYDNEHMFGVKNGFDIVITNPPYVSFGLRGVGKMTKEDKELIKELYPDSAEYKINLYALFMDRAIQLSSDKGIQVQIVPDSFLVGRYFSKVRGLILRKCQIKDILMLSSDVFDATVGFSVVYLTQRVEQVDADHHLRIIRPESRSNVTSGNLNYYQLNQSYYDKQKHKRFRLFFSDDEKQIIDKIEAESLELGTMFKGRTGVRSLIGQKNIISKEKLLDTHKKGLISGAQVKPYTIEYNDDWINIDPSLLNKGGWDKSIIENPKILVRQTGDTVIAAIDRSGYYHLNNMHSFAPLNSQQKVPMEYIVCILNSRLIKFYYQTISMEKGRPMAQTDIETLESLPIKVKDVPAISELYNKIQDNLDVGTTTNVTDDIDKIIYSVYGLNNKDIETIERATK